jgi:hypothetical protein
VTSLAQRPACHTFELLSDIWYNQIQHAWAHSIISVLPTYASNSQCRSGAPSRWAQSENGNVERTVQLPGPERLKPRIHSCPSSKWHLICKMFALKRIGRVWLASLCYPYCMAYWPLCSNASDKAYPLGKPVLHLQRSKLMLHTRNAIP